MLLLAREVAVDGVTREMPARFPVTQGYYERHVRRVIRSSDNGGQKNRLARSCCVPPVCPLGTMKMHKSFADLIDRRAMWREDRGTTGNAVNA